MFKRFLLTPVALATALTALPSQAQNAPAADATALMQRIEQMAADMAQLKAQLVQLQASQAAAARPAPAAEAARAATPEAAAPATVLSGYGELEYSRPRRQATQAQADLRRVVLGVAHRFDDQTRLVTEIEIEHGVSSAGDAGEVAVEQAYIEHQLTPTWRLLGGLFLMPSGLLNENHEPSAFLGVGRNEVETAIIPTTWREGGLMAVGQFDNGLTWQAGLSTGFNLGKWDASSTEGRESPLGAIHQEMSVANARNLAWFSALNWRGVPGLQLGGSWFSGGATQGLTPGVSSRITLWEGHARWTPGRWDISALVARGQISQTAALNAPLVGSATLIPARFDGAYVQAGYQLWRQGRYQLTPFARWETVNTGRSYADLGPGLTPSALPTERIVTLGANLQFAPGVVLKADWQRFGVNRDNDRTRLGLGWSF